MTTKSHVDLADLYFPNLDEKPYSYMEEQYHDWMQFVDMLCCMQIVIKENSMDESFQRIGTVYKDEDLMKALEPRPFQETKKWSEKILGIFQTLLKKGENAAQEGRFFPFDVLRMLQEFTYPEIMAVVLSFMPDLNRKYERIYTILQEEAPESVRPTVGFVYDMCSLFMPMQYEDATLIANEDSYLGRFVFDHTSFGRNDASSLSKRLCLNTRIRDFLMGNSGQMGKLYPYAKVLTGYEGMHILVPGEDIPGQIMNLMEGIMEEGLHGAICLVGEKGLGKKHMLRFVASRINQSILSVDFSLLMNMNYEERMEILQDIICKCMIEGLHLHLDNVDYQEQEKKCAKEILSYLKKHILLIFISTQQNEVEELLSDITCCMIKMERPSASFQKEFWKHFFENWEIEISPDLNLDVIVSKYSLTPSAMNQIIEQLVVEGVEIIDEEYLSEKIREKSIVNFGSKAKRLQTGFTWDDIKLNEESEKELKKILAYAKNRSVVYEDYGFGKKMPYGRGFSVLLYGPPGTGKTMAANVLANELKLDIYRIDLSQIGSKYIGETEKNLSAIFDTGKHANAILFFDEADALFTKRTEVSSSNDRYANAEIAYLLQKIEEYDGISFLATNNLNNFDMAFRRRITFIVPMNLPSADIRQQLWENVFPEGLPKEKIDFTTISENGEMSGSSIKAAALQAAYRAAHEKRPLSKMDVIDAIDTEYKKNGALSIRQQLIRGKL